MDTATTVAEKLMSLFAGLPRAYGTYDLSSPTTRDDKKIQGRAVTKNAEVTLQLWEDHVQGDGAGLGIIPIRDTNDCVFGAIDVDSYQGLDLRAIVVKLERNKLPLVVCRSKSGGAHIFLFTREPVSASRMKSKLGEVASFLGFGSSEIFPKQTQLLSERGDAGSWLNMPYFNGTRGMRYAVTSSGNALSVEEFLLEAEASAVSLEWFDQLIVIANDFADGPPCLQALCQVGFPPGTRNEGLYDAGVYLKKSRPDDWEKAMDEFNHSFMSPPLTIAEVQGVIKSLKRKDYHYGCSKHPIVEHCNAALCRTRKFGVGTGSAGRFPMLGGLTKLNTKPPIWFWTVEGVRMELTTEDLQDPRRFQRRCMDSLNMVPQMPGAPAWQAAVQHAMDSVTMIEAPVDASSEGQFWELLERFCTGRAQALSLDEIVLGKPFTDKRKTYFRMVDLLSFLTGRKFFEFKSVKIASMLKDAGAQHGFKNLKGRAVNFWYMNEFAKQSEGFEVPEAAKEQSPPF